MASSKSSKSILTSQVIDELKSAFPKADELPKLPIVESVILAILRENRSLQDSLRALNLFRTTYFDLNELRVSELREIQTIIGHFPDSELRARTIRKFLKQIFQKNYKYDIDGIAKKTFKEAKDDLKDYDALSSDFVMAQAQVQTLGGHAFPVDDRILLMAKRLGLVDQSADHANLRGILEKNIPKAQIHLAIGLIEEFVESVCTQMEPKCTVCRFKAVCPAYEAMLNPPKVNAKDSKKSDKSTAKPSSESSTKSSKAATGSTKIKPSSDQTSMAPASAEKPVKDGDSKKSTKKPASKSGSKVSSGKPNTPADSSSATSSASAKPDSALKPASDATNSTENPASPKPAKTSKTAAKPKAVAKKAPSASAKKPKQAPKKSK